MDKRVNNGYIDIKSSIKTKASPDCKPIKFKAIAGVSNAELIERYTVGEYKEEDPEEVDSK